MGQKVSIVLTDDIDGKELKDGQGETITFGIDGQTYEIDLSNKNANEMRSTINNYVTHARKISRTKQTTRRKRTQMGPSAKEIRDWARTNGYEVTDRGRIPSDVRDAYDAAH